MNPRLILISLCLILMAGCNSPKQKTLYKSDRFSVQTDKIVQGEYSAKAISRTEIHSDYQSPANANYPDIIEFKFSLNLKDNELPFGVNRYLKLIPKDGKVVSPVYKFGVTGTEKPDQSELGYLEPNTEFTVRLDMTQVLESFEKDGFYTDFNGEKLAKADFKAVYIAGGADPLTWDFENLWQKAERELKDPDGDGIYETTLIMNAFNPDAHTSQDWKLVNDISAYPTYESDQLMVDALYNLSLDETILNKEEDGTFRTGAKWPGVWTRDISYSVLLAYAILDPEYSKNSLRRKVNRNRIIQDTGSGGAWPVSTDRNTWALAAWEIYLATGDEDWLQEAFIVIDNSVRDDLLVIVSPETGMMRGESSFLDWRKQTYPVWMNNVDIYNSETLGTNAVHFRTYEILGQMAEKLERPADQYWHVAASIKKSINNHLWMSDKGYYAGYRYGRSYLSLNPKSETLGGALCILFDIANETQAKESMEKTPMTPYGAPCIYPQIPGIPPYHNDGIWPFVQAYWNWAAAKTGNEKALEHGLASIYRAAGLFLTNKENMVCETGDFRDTQINSDRQLWSVAGNLSMVLRVFLGMDLQPEGILLNPVIPESYGGQKSIKNFAYRNAKLDFNINGFGNKIASIKMDGAPLENAFIPGDLKGQHQIEIEMNNEGFGEAGFRIVDNEFAPQTPRVSIDHGELVWPAVENVKSYLVYNNGQLIKETTENVFSIPSGNYSQLQVASVDQVGRTSFLSEPIVITEENNIRIVEAEAATKPSTAEYINHSGKGFVEISKDLNRSIPFKVNIPEDGEYLIDFRYSNGSGPWNTDNKCAIRTLKRNKVMLGAVVMAQRGTDEWSNWGYSNSHRTSLKKGYYTFSLTFERYNENMNVDVNTAMVDYMRLIRVN